MKKRKISLLLAFLLLLPFSHLNGLAEIEALYTGKLRNAASLFSAPDLGAERVGSIPEGKSVLILDVQPAWLLVQYQGGKAAYIKRKLMDDISVKPIDPEETLPYPAVPNTWLAWVKCEAPILKEPTEGADILINMFEGARLALLDIENGWGRVIYHREYGYINTNLLSEIQLINQAAQKGSDAPIATYTSFYKITNDQSNLNRILNMQVACDRFNLYTFKPEDRLDFNKQIGPYTRRIGYLPANVLLKGEVVQGYGGGTCQVSSTLYNVILQLPGIKIVQRRAHGAEAASYLPHGADAAVGSETQNFIIKNQYPFPVRIDGSLQDGALTIALYRAE